MNRLQESGVRLLIGAALAFAVISVAWSVARDRPPPPKENLGLEKELDRQIEGLASSLPREIDAQTQLVAVTRDRDVVVYHYRTSDPGFGGGDRAAFYTPPPGFIARICADRDARATMMAGARLRYSYVGKGDAPVAEYDVDAHSCAQLPDQRPKG